MYHWGFVLWLSSVHVSAASLSLYEIIDFDDIQSSNKCVDGISEEYQFNILRQPLPSKKQSSLLSSSSRESYTDNSTSSLWTSFWKWILSSSSFHRVISSQFEWRTFVIYCVNMLKPNVYGELHAFLSAKKQLRYKSRYESIIFLSNNIIQRENLRHLNASNNASENVKLFSYYCYDYRVKSMCQITSFQTSLVDIIVKAKTGNASMSASVKNEILLTTKLLIETKEVPCFFIPESHKNGLLNLSDKEFNQSKSSVDYTATIVSYVKCWTASNVQKLEQNYEPKVALYDQECIRYWCLGEVLIELTSNSYFRNFFEIVSEKMYRQKERNDESKSDENSLSHKLEVLEKYHNVNVIDEIFIQYSDILFLLYLMSRMEIVCRLINRSIAILPGQYGNALALHAAYAHVAAIDKCYIYLQNQRNADFISDIVCEELEYEMIFAWSSAFKYSLNAYQFSKAFNALLELINCMESYLGGSSENWKHNGVIISWRSCLRSLISAACNSGNVHWLCSLILHPDVCFKNIDIIQEISMELENLANSCHFIDLKVDESFSGRDFVGLSIHQQASPTGANASNSNLKSFSVVTFYDCLGSFLISNQQYREAARIFFQLATRLELECSLSQTAREAQLR